MNWTFLLPLAGKILLAFYFFHAGIKNIVHYQKRVSLLRAKKFPLPFLSVIVGILCQLLGSLAIVFNYAAVVGAILLIMFTLASNFFICDYWHKQGPERFLTSAVFFANCAVIGGLLLVLAIAR